MGNWIRRRPLVSFFVLAFLWSWLWWLSLIFSTPADAFLAGNIPPAFFVFAILGGFGPSISGLVISRVVSKGGGRVLLGGLKKPRLQLKWFLFALLCVPVLTAAQALAHGLTGRAVTWNVSAMTLVMGLVWPVFSSFGEELGWRGFALPRMLEKNSFIKASLLLGFVWGMWHLPSDYIAYSSYGLWFIPLFLLLGPVNLMAHSVIMTFIYKRTGGNLLAMVAYHYTITMAGILSPGFSFDGKADDVLKSAVSVAVIVLGAFIAALWQRRKTYGTM